MKTTTDYTFEVSLSTRGFEEKPDRDTEVPNLHFTKKTVDVSDFLIYMLDGYCYTGIYSSDSFGMKERDKDNYLYTYLVSIDVDHSSETMNDMVNRLEYKPTCSYTTFRNGLDGESRFRMVYCFDNKIMGGDEYRNLVYAIFDANKLDFNEKVNRHRIFDSQSPSAYQYYNGNGTNTVEVMTTDIIYNIKDFNINYNINDIDDNIIYNNSNIDNKIVIKNYIYHTPHNNIHLNESFEDKQFEDDFWNLKIEDILSKYVNVYPNLQHTPLEIPDDDTPVILLPPDYTEIRRVCRVGKNSKYIRVNDGSPIKIKDGQGRRRTLFWNGILRRLINPGITFDNLVYNLLFELCYYITNYKAENIIGKKEIYQIAKSVMKEDMSKHEHLRGRDREYIANPGYCTKHRVKPNQATKIYKGMKTAARIGELYDCSLKDKENLRVMKENGLDIEESTLYRWKKANGLIRRMNNDQN